jgi:hypothetical protein
MNSLAGLWGQRFTEPVFALTADQDWAPEWAMERFLNFVAEVDVPLHVFVTNRSAALERSQNKGVTLGAHPNFLPGSSHGSTAEEVITTCRTLVPDAHTFRCHAYAEDAFTLALLIEAGFETDSNLCLFLQSQIVPLIHATGILRLPVFLDDDSFLLWAGDWGMDLEPMKAALASPGLKILNFHPTLFAINCPSAEHYRVRRGMVYDPGAEPIPPYQGRGAGNVLEELIEWIRASGRRLSSFQDIAATSWRDLRSSERPALYGWGKQE